MSKFAPARLRASNRWVRHVAKRPVRPNGAAASSTNPESWSSFDEAMSGKAGDGVGFVLNGDGIVCVDLDGCVSDGRLSAWAEQIVSMFPGAAVEVSLSGRGLHIWGTGPNLSKVFDYNGSRVEVYADKRYIAMTGRWLGHNNLIDLTDGLVEMGLK